MNNTTPKRTPSPEDFFISKHGDKIDKIERYAWPPIPDKQGCFMLVDKADILVDHTYQRTKISWSRVNKIARAWSWKSCGCLSIAQRQDGNFYAFEGQHRLLAAKKRSDIKDMPCLVFESDSIPMEARAFHDINTNRTIPTAFARYNSLVEARDETALQIRDMLATLGLYVQEASGNDTKNWNRVACIGAVSGAIVLNKSATYSALKLAAELTQAENGPITDRLFSALFHVYSVGCKYAKTTKEGDADMVYASKVFRKRALEIGQTRILSRIRAWTENSGKGGPRIWAQGLIMEINKSLRYQFELNTPAPKAPKKEKKND